MSGTFYPISIDERPYTQGRKMIIDLKFLYWVKIEDFSAHIVERRYAFARPAFTEKVSFAINSLVVDLVI